MDPLMIRDLLRLLPERHLMVRLSDATSHRLTARDQAFLTRIDFHMQLEFDPHGVPIRSILGRPEDVAAIEVVEPTEQNPGRRWVLPPG